VLAAILYAVTVTMVALFWPTRPPEHQGATP
jgi:hypothetical protein